MSEMIKGAQSRVRPAAQLGQQMQPNPKRLIIGATTAFAAMTALLMTASSNSAVTELVGAPAILIGVGFFAAEVWVVHLPSRRGAHSLSLVEIPLAVGLLSLSPFRLIVTALVSVGAALALARRMRGMKLAFNLANSTAGIALAAYVVHRWGVADAEVEHQWPVLFAALSAESLFTSLNVVGAVTLSNPGRSVREVKGELLTATAWTLLGAYLGTLLATAMLFDPLIAAMSLGLVLGGVAASRLYGRLHLRHVELESVHAVARVINTAEGVEELTDTFLRETAEQMRVRHIWVAYGSDQVEWRWHHFDRGTLERFSFPIRSTPAADLEAMLPPNITEAAGRAIGNPIRAGDVTIGRAVVADRTGPDPLTENDENFLATVSGMFGSALARALTDQKREAENREKQRVIQSKDQLITAVSHELRTPLTGILGFAETLKDSEPSDAEAKEMLRFIAEQSLDLSNIVEDLLTAARHDLDNLAVHLVPTELAELATAAVVSMTGRLERAPILELEPVPGLADPQRLRQILRNLLSNAAKYGGDRIRVRVSATKTGPVISVSDDGPGIGGNDPEAIFQPYVSAHAGSGGQPGSVGIGLTISRRLARMMGGDILYSHEDGWTTFTVRLQHPPKGASGRAGTAA